MALDVEVALSAVQGCWPIGSTTPPMIARVSDRSLLSNHPSVSAKPHSLPSLSSTQPSPQQGQSDAVISHTLHDIPILEFLPPCIPDPLSLAASWPSSYCRSLRSLRITTLITRSPQPLPARPQSRLTAHVTYSSSLFSASQPTLGLCLWGSEQCWF